MRIDTENICIDCSLLHKLATVNNKLALRDAWQPQRWIQSSLGVKRVVQGFRGYLLLFTPTPCSQTMKLLQDTQCQERDNVLSEAKNIYSSPLATLSPVSGTAANNKLCKASIGVWKGNDKKGNERNGAFDGYLSPEWFAFVFCAGNKQENPVKSQNTL